METEDISLPTPNRCEVIAEASSSSSFNAANAPIRPEKDEETIAIKTALEFIKQNPDCLNKLIMILEFIKQNSDFLENAKQAIDSVKTNSNNNEL